MFKYIKNKLYCENVSVEEIVKETLTPVYIYSKNQLIKNFKEFDNAFKNKKHLICYAVKANTNREICKILFKLGAGADITSGGELYRVIKSGINPEKIVYAGTGKTKDEIIYAVKNKILMFNVESVEELKLINKIGAEFNKKINIALRVNPNINPHTHKFISTGLNITKFGIPIKEIIDVYKYAKFNLKYLNIQGIHCHIGSQITQIKPFVIMTEKILDIVKKLKKINIDLNYINFGGGLGIKYNNEIPPTPKELSNNILKFLKNTHHILIFEPGRYIVGNTGILVTKILYKKQANKKNFLIVDAGMNDLIRPAFYSSFHKIITVNLKKTKKIKYDIVGPICETSDFLGKDRYLPELNSGDLIAVSSTGAYGFSMSSQYNSRPRPPEIMVDNNNWYITRKRENYIDLIKNEI